MDDAQSTDTDTNSRPSPAARIFTDYVDIEGVPGAITLTIQSHRQTDGKWAPMITALRAPSVGDTIPERFREPVIGLAQETQEMAARAIAAAFESSVIWDELRGPTIG